MQTSTELRSNMSILWKRLNNEKIYISQNTLSKELLVLSTEPQQMLIYYIYIYIQL